MRLLSMVESIQIEIKIEKLILINQIIYINSELLLKCEAANLLCKVFFLCIKKLKFGCLEGNQATLPLPSYAYDKKRIRIRNEEYRILYGSEAYPKQNTGIKINMMGTLGKDAVRNDDGERESGSGRQSDSI